MPALSIVVPAWNEAVNLPELVARTGASLAAHGISYEIIVVDDRSDDDTIAVLDGLAARFPVRCQAKCGPQGKGYSLLEGFGSAAGDVVCMIDGDLQYPPESIAPMAARVFSGQADLVVANRRTQPTGLVRRIASSAWKFLSRRLQGLDVDTQAGLKVMRREILDRISLRPSAWAVDLDLLVNARKAGYLIASHDIEFAPRRAGASKLRVSAAAGQLLTGAVRLMVAGGRPATAWASDGMRTIRPHRGPQGTPAPGPEQYS
jgi:dolichol-phosphate mannosyltransferase